jgi:undecaprenyl diphosphate synthase
MSVRDQLKKDKIPVHVAIIMDGNGRWAKKRGKLRIFGHSSGVSAVKKVVEAAAEINVKYLTLYAFSTENWKRPAAEIDALMALLISTINAEIRSLKENNIRLQAIGNLDSMPPKVRKELLRAIKETSENTGLNLVLALSYSSRWEILNAVRTIGKDITNGIILPENISEEIFNKYLCTHNIPDPELLIRTSGEIRVSNFLLWQLVYTELYFTDTLWPDFGKEEFFTAILDYQNRERRFGKTSDQMKNNK